MTFTVRRWIRASAEERADVIEHLEAEADAMLEEGDPAGALWRAAASILKDVVHLPELVEEPEGKAPTSPTTDTTPKRRNGDA